MYVLNNLPDIILEPVKIRTKLAGFYIAEFPKSLFRKQQNAYYIVHVVQGELGY